MEILPGRVEFTSDIRSYRDDLAPRTIDCIVDMMNAAPRHQPRKKEIYVKLREQQPWMIHRSLDMGYFAALESVHVYHQPEIQHQPLFDRLNVKDFYGFSESERDKELDERVLRLTEYITVGALYVGL